MKEHLIQCDTAQSAADTAAHINRTAPAQVKAQATGDMVHVRYDAPIADLVTGLFDLVSLVIEWLGDVWQSLLPLMRTGAKP